MLTPLAGQLSPNATKGTQSFVDWRYVRAGFVGWHAGARRVGVWEPAPADTLGKPEAPFGIRLCAQPAQNWPTLVRDKPWEYAYQIHTVMYDRGYTRLVRMRARRPFPSANLPSGLWGTAMYSATPNPTMG